MLLTMMRHGLPMRGGGDPADPALAPEGERQAAAMASALRSERVDAIYASPQSRAMQTAEFVSAELQLPVRVEPGLVEFDYGAPYVHFEDGDPIWERYFAGDLSAWGTTLQAFRSRIRTALGGIAQRHSAENVLAVCHGGVVNSWACCAMGQPERVRMLNPDYGSVHRFEFDGEKWRVLSLNESVADLDMHLL